MAVGARVGRFRELGDAVVPDVAERRDEQGDVAKDGAGPRHPFLAFFAAARGHAFGPHGRLDPCRRHVDEPRSELLQEVDPLVDVERHPLVLVVLEDGECFVEPGLRGGLDSMLGLGDRNGTAHFGGDLGHRASLLREVSKLGGYQEGPNLVEGVAHARWREASHEYLSIALSPDARVENGDHPSVLRRPNESSKDLFKRKRGGRNEVAHE